jgi:hypothetical protein
MRGQAIGALADSGPTPAELTAQPGRSHSIAENQDQLTCMRLTWLAISHAE